MSEGGLTLGQVQAELEGLRWVRPGERLTLVVHEAAPSWVEEKVVELFGPDLVDVVRNGRLPEPGEMFVLRQS